MGRFRTKPKEIEAWQHITDGKTTKTKGICQSLTCFSKNPFMHVHTMHKGQIVAVENGDWIVPEPDGEHYYPVKDEVFRDKYEEIV